MQYHLTGVNEEKREIYLVSEDEAIEITIDASAEAWSGKDTDIEVITAPNGSTVYYWDENGEKTFKNYRFDANGATIV